MSFGMIPLSPDDKPDSFVLLSMYEKLESENAELREQSERLFDKTLELAAKNDRLRELLDFALPIAMYAASTEEGDRIRELMREVEL